MHMRLDKMLSNSGKGTRSTVAGLIRAGRVCVNGIIVKDAGFHVTDEDIVEIAGERAEHKKFLYYKLDKPDSVLTAMEDKRLPTIAQFIPPESVNLKLSPVGRLDYHTTGLLIITNDGQLSHRLTSPKYRIPKKYRILYDGEELTREHVDEAAAGITLTDRGRAEKLAPAELSLVSPGIAELILYEGKTHEVRRIISYWGRTVSELRRISIANITLSEDSTPGTIEEIDGKQINILRQLTGLNDGPG